MRDIFFLFIVIVLFSSSLYSQNRALDNDVKSVILSCFLYRDMNPIHKAEQDSIYCNFKMALTTRSESSLTDIYDQETAKLFERIYNNSSNEYEDAVDSYRLRKRRATDFATIALKQTNDKAYTFLEYAKLSLTASINNPDLYGVENEYLGLLLIEILFRNEEGYSFSSELTKVETFLKMHKKHIRSEIYSTVTKLVFEYRNNR